MLVSGGVGKVMTEFDSSVPNDSDKPLRAEDIRDLNRFKMAEFKKGDYIIRQGDEIKYAYFLIHGNIKLSTLTNNGDEIIYDYRVANDSIRCFVGGLSMYRHDHRHRSSFIAETACHCRKMTRQQFRQFMYDHPAVTDAFITLVMERWTILDDNFLLRQARNTPGQVCATVLSYMEYRNGDYYLNKKITNSNIARFVGANRVTVVRIMKELERRGIIEKTMNGVRIVDPQALELYRSGEKILQYRNSQNK